MMFGQVSPLGMVPPHDHRMQSGLPCSRLGQPGFVGDVGVVAGVLAVGLEAADPEADHFPCILASERPILPWYAQVW